jgi:hypothetical protein
MRHSARTWWRSSGGARTEESRKGGIQRSAPSRTLLFRFRYGDDGREQKEIFKHPHEFEQYVLANFHDYFQPLRGLVKEWFHLLILAHQVPRVRILTTFTIWFLKSLTVHWRLRLLTILTKLGGRCSMTGKQTLGNCWMRIPSERFKSLHLLIHLLRVKEM